MNLMFSMLEALGEDSTFESNPMTAVRVKGGSKRVRTPMVLRKNNTLLLCRN